MLYLQLLSNLPVHAAGRAYRNAYFGTGSGPIFLDGVQCISSSSKLLECYSRPILSHNCLHSADAGVGCEGTLSFAMQLTNSNHYILLLSIAPCTTGQLRLAGSNIPNEGRVEICISNEWGTVCDDFWGSADASVVCRQLGYTSQGQGNHIRIEKCFWMGTSLTIAMCMSAGVVPFNAAHFGAGIGPIYLDNVECSGSESRLIDCLYSSFVSCSRGHSEDAGVRCQGNISVLISRFFLYPKELQKSMEEMMLFGPFIGLRWYDLTMQINLIQTYE